MERLYQLYLNNITLARNLTKPQVSFEMSKNEIIQTIHDSAEHLNQIHQEDDEILKKGTVDFYTFSYYMSNCVSTDPEVKAQSGGNLMGGVANPYLKASDWGWRIVWLFKIADKVI